MFGPRIQYSSTGTGFYGGGRQPTYADLMTARSSDDVGRSYLSSEASFRFLKDLETRNLVVPVVGNFAGPKAIRAVGQILKEAKGRSSRPSTCPTLKCIFSRTGSGATSAAMWRRCRSTRPAHSSDRFAVDATARAPGSTRSSGTWLPRWKAVPSRAAESWKDRPWPSRN